MTKEQLADSIVIAYKAVSDEQIDKEKAMLFMEWLEDVPCSNPRCIIFAGLWCSFSQLLVANFLIKQQSYGKNLNSLREVYWLFHDKFAYEIFMDDNKGEFEKHARKYLQYVGDMDLSEYGVPEYVKEDEWI